MAGPWEKYQATPTESPESSAMPWEKYQVAAPKESPLASAVRQGVQGLTANFSDEIVGGIEAVGRAAGFEGAGGPMKDIRRAEGGATLDTEVLKQAYLAGRDHERQALVKDTRDNPKASLAGNLVGAVASPINKILPGASMARQGAAVGTVAAVGASDADNAAELIEDAGMGLGMGAAFGKVADEASPIISKGIEKAKGGLNSLGEKIGQFSSDRAAAALGANKALKKSIGEEKVLEAAKTAMDEGTIGWFTSPKEMAQRSSKLRERGGKMMGEVYEKIDDANASSFNPENVATKVDEKIGGFWRSPINRGETNQLDNTLEAIRMRGKENLPLKEAQILKEEIGKTANWKNKVNVTAKEEMARDAYRVVSNAIDDAAEAGSEVIGEKGLKAILREGNRLSSHGRTAERLLEDRVAQSGNNFFGLTDYIAAGAGLGYGGSTGDWDTAVGLLAAKKLGQRYGNQVAAKLTRKAANALLQKPAMQKLSQTSPRAFQAAVIKMAHSLGNEGKFPAAAESDGPPNKDTAPTDPTRPLKGTEKWAHDGAEKLRKHGVDISATSANPKVKTLLMQASDLKPGSKAMQNVVTQINRLKKDGE